MAETTDGTLTPEQIQAQVLKRIASGEAQQYNQAIIKRGLGSGSGRG